MSAGPFLGITKKPHWNSTFVGIIVTLHMPNGNISELLYACNVSFFYLYFFDSVFGVLWNRIINMLMGTKLPSIATSVQTCCLWLVFCFQVGNEY